MCHVVRCALYVTVSDCLISDSFGNETPFDL